MAQRIYGVLYAADIGVGAIIWGNPGESISAHLAAEHGVEGHWFCRAVDWVALSFRISRKSCRAVDWVALSFRQPDHCRGALLAYEARERVAPYGQ
jgi:hypothetical protein